MDRNKIILLIVLVLIVAAYVFFVVWGATSDDNRGNDHSKPQKTPVTADNYSPYPATKNFGNLMGDWLGRFLPKSGINCSIPAAKDSELTCEAIAIGETRISAKKGTSFRLATLVWKKGEVDVKYDDEADATGNSKMDDHQDFVLASSGPNTEKKSTIIIFEKGGTLTISCLHNTSCQVGLK
jgi:hypothetical protein